MFSLTVPLKIHVYWKAIEKPDLHIPSRLIHGCSLAHPDAAGIQPLEVHEQVDYRGLDDTGQTPPRSPF